MTKNKPTLFLVPVYMGNIKFFEKIIPYLETKYNIFLLFLPETSHEKKNRTIEMEKYCKEKKINYIKIKKAKTPFPLNFIPFFSPLKFLFDFRTKIKKTLSKYHVKKIITVVDMNIFYSILFNEAHKQNVDTMTIQWAITYESMLKQKKSNFSFKTPYYKLINRLQRKIFKIKNNKPKILGNGQSKKFGVINELAYNLFDNAGIDTKKMSVIGYIDFHLAKEKQKMLQDHQKLKEKIIKKLNINTNKKNICIFITPFHTKDFKILSIKEHLDYYKKIIKEIRKTYERNEADILLKIHPAENLDIYKSFKKENVKIYDKNIRNEELIFFSDLYIAHHSTTNYIPITMNKDAIFINFINLKRINITKKYYGIKKYISNFSEFNTMLNEHKKNCLKKQYKNNDKIITKDSLKKIINWID